MNFEITEGKVFKAKDGNLLTVLSVEENGVINYSIENDDKFIWNQVIFSAAGSQKKLNKSLTL